MTISHGRVNNGSSGAGENTVERSRKKMRDRGMRKSSRARPRRGVGKKGKRGEADREKAHDEFSGLFDLLAYLAAQQASKYVYETTGETLNTREAKQKVPAEKRVVRYSWRVKYFHFVVFPYSSLHEKSQELRVELNEKLKKKKCYRFDEPVNNDREDKE